MSSPPVGHDDDDDLEEQPLDFFKEMKTTKAELDDDQMELTTRLRTTTPHKTKEDGGKVTVKARPKEAGRHIDPRVRHSTRLERIRNFKWNMKCLLFEQEMRKSSLQVSKAIAKQNEPYRTATADRNKLLESVNEFRRQLVYSLEHALDNYKKDSSNNH